MLLEVAFSLFSVYFIWWIVKTYQERRRMPPGPIPLPILGNLWQMRFGMSASCDKLRERYGDIYTLSLAMGTVVVVNSANLAREALIDRNDDVAGRTSGSMYPLDVVLGGKDIALEDFTPQLLIRRKVFRSAMHIYGNFGVEQTDRRAHDAAETLIKEIEKMNGRPFSPINYVRLAMISSIWQWLSSKKYSLDHPTITSLDEFVRKMHHLSALGSIYRLIPMTKYLPTKFNSCLNEVLSIRDDIFRKEFRMHRATYSSEVTRDLTDGFLSAYEKEIMKKSAGDSVSVEDVEGLMMASILGGVDTSSSYANWFLLYVALYQDVQDKIHAELDNVIGKGRHPRWNDAEDLHYFQATILEVMRHSSALPMFQRKAIRNTTIGGYKIPRNTSVLFNIGRMNNDPKVWQDPNSFKPGRFLDDDGKFPGWATYLDFLPFGVGRRRCAGENLAKIVVFTFLSTILHRFRLEVADGQIRPTLESAEADSIMLEPKEYKISAIERICE